MHSSSIYYAKSTIIFGIYLNMNVLIMITKAAALPADLHLVQTIMEIIRKLI